MPSSVRFGVRPRIVTARSNSSRVSPCSAARSAVALLPTFIGWQGDHPLPPTGERVQWIPMSEESHWRSDHARTRVAKRDQDQPPEILGFQLSRTGDNRAFQAELGCLIL